METFIQFLRICFFFCFFFFLHTFICHDKGTFRSYFILASDVYEMNHIILDINYVHIRLIVVCSTIKSKYTISYSVWIVVTSDETLDVNKFHLK